MESAAKAISELEYCVARYGKEDSFTFAAYQALMEMKAMKARIDELSKDAARYRWLRQQHWSEKGMCVLAEAENARLGSFCPSGDLLDATIDAAMKD